METFETLLDKSITIHGHLCPGQVIGVRMAIYGLDKIGITDPKGDDRKSLYIIVEIDRCATDAIQSVTGCSLGKRSLKWQDYGIMAATFVNLQSNKAVRITAREEARELAKNYCPGIEKKSQQQLEAYKMMDKHDLFTFQEVTVTIPKFDLPGKPLKRVRCQECGDWVQDGRDLSKADQTLCRGCGSDSGKYYKVIA